jgi:two-component system, NtrC family, sensor histidine kinase AtoS
MAIPKFSNLSLAALSNLKRFKPGNDHLEALFELLPLPSFLLDEENNRIFLINSRAKELTGYSREEIVKITLNHLLPDLSLNNNNMDGDGDPKALMVSHLIDRTGIKLEVLAQRTEIDPKGGFHLLTLEPISEIQKREADNLRKVHILDAVQHLARSFYESSLESAITRVLEAGKLLTGAQILAVYHIRHEKVKLIRGAGVNSEVLPDQINANDMFSLNTPWVWTSRMRPLAGLHRAARNANLSYLATAPLGEDKVALGLVVAGGITEPSTVDILPILQSISSAITALIENNALITALQKSVTEKKKAIEMGRTIQDTIQEGILVLSPNLHILEINPAAESILGYTCKEVFNEPYQHILFGSNSLITDIHQKDQTTVHDLGNIRMYRRDGQDFLARVRTMPLIIDAQLECVLVFIQDLSQEEEYRIRNQQLEQRALIGEVSAIFAHEVRNPINNISTGLQLMAHTLPEDDSHRKVIDRLQQDCERLEALMDSTLNFVRPVEYKMEAIDLKVYLPRLVDRWRLHMSRVNIQHEVQIDPNTPSTHGDMRALDQVWNNLISNAINAMGKEGGSLVVKIRPTTTKDNISMVEVNISDTGPGIPDDIRERIFEPFFTTNSKGTGLGLSISKHIISTHRGTIDVTSIPGATSFQVRLPVSNK